jgi:hypothetical protein
VTSTNGKFLASQHLMNPLLNPEVSHKESEGRLLAKKPDVSSLKGDMWELSLLVKKAAASDPDLEPPPGVHVALKVSVVESRLWQSQRLATCVIPLTDWTAEELDMFEKYISEVVENARIIARARDDTARGAAESGDDSYPRTDRVVPRVVRRPRFVDEHGRVIWDNVEPGLGRDVQNGGE